METLSEFYRVHDNIITVDPLEIDMSDRKPMLRSTCRIGDQYVRLDTEMPDRRPTVGLVSDQACQSLMGFRSGMSIELRKSANFL